MAFVFRFGYETPVLAASNPCGGWDDEFSNYVVIEAPDAATALDWGCEVAERFVQGLGSGSWRAGNFARWVEPLSECPWAVGREMIVVGQLPDFTRWV